MRIAKISVDGLFGTFNHVIQTNLNDRITIIYGPNGFGKTTLLRMITDLFTGRFGSLRSIPFAQFQVDFDNGESLCVERRSEGRQRKRSAVQELAKLGLVYTVPGSEPKTYDATTEHSRELRGMGFPLGLLSEAIPALSRVGAESWHDSMTGEILSLEEVMDRYPDALPMPFRDERSSREPEWLRNIRTTMNVRFIDTQRLLVPSRVRSARNIVKANLKFPKKARIKLPSSNVRLGVRPPWADR